MIVRAMPDPLVPGDREAKLPTWARDTLAVLRTRCESYRREAVDAQAALEAYRGDGPEDSDTFIDKPDVGPQVRLGRGTRIRFALGQDPAGYRWTAEAHVAADSLVVEGFGRQLAVVPLGLNMIRLRVEP